PDCHSQGTERRGADVDGTAFGLALGTGLGVLCGAAGLMIHARLRANAARGLAAEILAEARREAETTRKEADLRSKEEALRRREAIDAEAERTRRDLREHEKRLEKRADLLDQKLDFINKKEREFESLQRILTEQQEELQRRNTEVKAVLA